MITKYGSKPIGERISRLSTAAPNPEILELRAFLRRKPVVNKSVAIKRKKVFILWGGGMYQREDKHIIHDDGREEWVKKECYSDNGLMTFFLACMAISISITSCYLIVSGARNNEAKDSRGGTGTIQESSSYLRKNQRPGY
jgi:hypothetical protein